jgi:hypothetical protein
MVILLRVLLSLAPKMLVANACVLFWEGGAPMQRAPPSGHKVSGRLAQ